MLDVALLFGAMLIMYCLGFVMCNRRCNSTRLVGMEWKNRCLGVICRHKVGIQHLVEEEQGERGVFPGTERYHEGRKIAVSYLDRVAKEIEAIRWR